MKRVLWLFPFFVFVVFVELRLGGMPNLFSLRRDLLERQASSIETLVLGACDAQSALKPSVWGTEGFTLASSNQTPFISAQLLERWLPKLPNVRTVVFSSTYFMWESRLRNEPEAWRNFYYQRFLGISGDARPFDWMDLNRWSLFFLYWPESRSLIFETKVKQSYGLFDGERLPFVESLPSDGWRGFRAEMPQSTDYSRGDLFVRELSLHIKPENIPRNQAAMERVVRRAGERGIRFVFLKTPLLPRAYEALDSAKVQRERKLVSDFQSNLGVEYFDYSADSRFSEADFLDLGHLNEAGAEKFSAIVAKEVLGSRSP